MHSDDWTEDTIPSRRVPAEGPGGRQGERAGANRASIPVAVWFLGAAVIVLALAVSGLWALYLLRGQVTSSGPTPTPIIWTPTAAPPTLAPTLTLTPTQEAVEPTPTISPDIAIGRYVQVMGTGGYGLSLRSGPGENYTRMDVAVEGGVFVVVDGPTVSAGAEWWKIQAYENPERVWWAVGNFLQPVEHP
jgi:hypothetical protein